MSDKLQNPTYPRGSEWRKWDLQIHTPFSELNNGFGTDIRDYTKRMLNAALEKKISVVGLTDYFCIDGFKAVRSLLADKSFLEAAVGKESAITANQILFLPNIEFRSSIIIRDPKGNDSRVNFHVLFSDKVSVGDIEENFLREIKFTVEGNPSGPEEQWPLTISNLTALGKKLREQHENFRMHSDLFVGMMNAVVDHREATKILENKPSLFKDRFLICLPCDEDLSKCKWDGQGHLTRKVFIQKSHILFSSNESTRLFALGKKHSSEQEYIAEFKTLKPCLHGSDGHDFNKIFEPDGKLYTWVKADPTFQGLRQVLNEPEDRVFIGQEPESLKRVTEKSTRVVDTVSITKRQNSNLAEKWFNVTMPLNPELVAIIGNKGSGKSALADVLGLVGNTPRFSSFSFLRADRFRDSKNKAKHFTASIRWCDGSSEPSVGLENNPEAGAVEKIKYIPQNYLEEICNEVGLGKGSRFYAELQDVIFSHVPKSDRLGFGNLDDLLKHRTEEVNQSVGLQIEELRQLNESIVACEDRLAPENEKLLRAKLAEKQRELEAHNERKPKEVRKPDDDPDAVQQAKQAADNLEKKQQELQKIETEITQLKAADSELAKNHSAGEKLLGQIQNASRQFETILRDTTPAFNLLGIKQQDVISVSINLEPIKTVLEDIALKRSKNAEQLSQVFDGGLEMRRQALVKEIQELQSKLSERQKEYQNYLQALKQWEQTKGEITGSADAQGSVKNLEKSLEDLKDLPNILRKYTIQRHRKARDILRQKQRLLAFFSNYYGDVQKFLNKHPVSARQGFKLAFNVAMAQAGFGQSFLPKINKRKLGPFMGNEEANTTLEQMLKATDWDSPVSCLRFAKTVIEKMRNHEGRSLEIKEQLQAGNSVGDFYNFIFSFDYISPIYRLTWDEKGLEQLSPGERGNLLLIFYLLVDTNDIPLVIDQPEENLDNQTVFKTLVPSIKDAKKRRQIIIVTHNPNLAVVCDAEQIIYSEIHKEQQNEVFYVSGSIEEFVINRRILDVLEGTRPAFDKRDAKYLDEEMAIKQATGKPL